MSVPEVASPQYVEGGYGFSFCDISLKEMSLREVLVILMLRFNARRFRCKPFAWFISDTSISNANGDLLAITTTLGDIGYAIVIPKSVIRAVSLRQLWHIGLHELAHVIVIPDDLGHGSLWIQVATKMGCRAGVNPCGAASIAATRPNDPVNADLRSRMLGRFTAF
jgi:hypothetical protein